MTAPVVPRVDEARRAKRLAWWSLALFPVCFVAAFLVGEGLFTLTGQSSEQDTVAPLWAVLVAGVPALIVFSAPAALAVHFGRRAMRLGLPEGLTPVVVALTVAGAFIVMNVLSYVVGLIAGG